jgi:hypothetical protein
MQIRYPAVIPRFNIKNLVSRRSLVFARAGFGKSNLNKLLFSHLYKQTPTVEKRGGREAPVGTIIFDPDGEYFWPDDKNRPGLCDVPELEDKIVLFTNRRGPSEFYDSFIAGNIKLDIRRLRPTDVISIAVSPEKQEQQNIRKLKQMNDADWATLVDEIYSQGNKADDKLIKRLLHLEDNQEAEMAAARANVTAIVKMLHDPSSMMMDMLLYALKQGKLCIVDLSGMRGQAGFILSGLILQKIFNHNQNEFTKAEPETIPVIAVVEEAQSVLGQSDGNSAEGPYITWVKEGRKYDLGAVLITQQPASISHEILSQGDNWFVFHLLSAGDLQALKKANAHFSDDILSALLNEPIPGHCVFWSSVQGKTYPISVRVMSFEQLYSVRDPGYNLSSSDAYATKLKGYFNKSVAEVGNQDNLNRDNADSNSEGNESGSVDVIKLCFREALASIRNSDIPSRIRNGGVPWAAVQNAIAEVVPDTIDDKWQFSYQLVPLVLDNIFGNTWDTDKRPKKDGSGTATWVVIK